MTSPENESYFTLLHSKSYHGIYIMEQAKKLQTADMTWWKFPKAEHLSKSSCVPQTVPKHNENTLDKNLQQMSIIDRQICTNYKKKQYKAYSTPSNHSCATAIKSKTPMRGVSSWASTELSEYFLWNILCKISECYFITYRLVLSYLLGLNMWPFLFQTYNCFHHDNMFPLVTRFLGNATPMYLILY